MSTYNILTLTGNVLSLGPYTAGLNQKFKIVPQVDGSVGIRNLAAKLVLTMSEGGVWAAPYAGNTWQSFIIEYHEDGTCALHSRYQQLVLEATNSGVFSKPYVPDSKIQRFELLNMPDGSFMFQKLSKVFNSYVLPNSLQGSMAANVQFAQSQVFPATPKPDDSQPHLISGRKALMLVTPLTPIDRLQLSMLTKEGELIGALECRSPDELPRTVYHIDDEPNTIDFTPEPGTPYTVCDNPELVKLTDPDGVFLKEKIRAHNLVIISLADGRWIENIYLPADSSAEGKAINIQSDAAYHATLYYSGRSAVISRGTTLQLKYTSNQWISDAEWANRAITYAENTWSTNIPGHWLIPGMIMRFESSHSSGQLNNLEVGPPTELIIHTIDIGMLTPARGAYLFASDPQAHREYYQTIPVTRLIVAGYESIHLPEVMLPDGKLLTDFDPSSGGWQSGVMRQSTAKELISLGINHANYGINSSPGQGEWTPFLTGQLTAHNSQGKYANGVQVHGGSGGEGIVTLDNSLGNEFSHEVGHNYGLSHFPGGFNGSVHRAANEINSTWGWDKDLEKFVPNFTEIITNREACLNGACQLPFHGRSFGFDPMAGGAPLSAKNRFTLHTPYTAKVIQDFMEHKAVFANNSSTGFQKWNPRTQRMESYQHRADLKFFPVAANDNLNETAIAARLNVIPYLKVAMWDGNYAPLIQVPRASANNARCIIVIEHQAGYSSNLHINGQAIVVTRGSKITYISDGETWTETILLEANMDRITAPNVDLNESRMAGFLASHSVVTLAMSDGNYTSPVHIPPASTNNNERVIIIEHAASYNMYFHINGLIMTISKGTKKYFKSNGSSWKEYVQVEDISTPRSPRAFGVPVTTLVGYYDPDGKLASYIFPALQGAYGFIYEDDALSLPPIDCELCVYSDPKTLRFQLYSHRMADNVMNKFHINIESISKPCEITIERAGIELARRTIVPARVPLAYSINGE